MTHVRPRARHRAWTAALLGGVSMIALVTVCGAAMARSLNSIGRTVEPAAAAIAAQQAAAQQAAAAAARAQASLGRAAAALQAARQLQDAARGLFSAQPSIPDGVAAGGLMPKSGADAISSTSFQVRTDPAMWQGASSTIDQNVVNGRTVVDLYQTQSKAILTWDTFNVGRNTTLNFNQAAPDWTALNRVVDPDAAPSRILGQINAIGGVYVINRNGIVFGAGSQVNVHALVASTLDVGKLGFDRVARDKYFLDTGIGNQFSFSVFDDRPGLNTGQLAATTILPGDVTIERGATIKTDIVDLDSSGFVYLFGANVRSSGQITAPAGQVAMAATRAVTLTPGEYQAAGFPADVLPSNVTFRASGLQLQNFSTGYVGTVSSSQLGNPINGRYLDGTGSVVADGLIETPRGIVTLAGNDVEIGESGVISADTSISRNSMVLLHAATRVAMNGVISMGPGSDPLTSELPQKASAGSNVQTFMPAYVEMSAQRSVSVGSNGLISAPSATVALNATRLGGSGASRQLFNANADANNPQGTIPTIDGEQQVLLASGSVIDVAGLQNVELPVAANFISFIPRAEFADMPLQRSGPLYGQTFWIDIRASGTRKDGTAWLGTPLADATETVNAKGRSLYELMTAGGDVTLATDLTPNSVGVPAAGRSVLKEAGSVINMAGGNIRYTGGIVPKTRLIGIDGRIYSMENADPDMIYLGIAGLFSVNHSRWGVVELWNAFKNVYEPGYIDGQAAGGLAVSTVSPSLEGVLYFGSVAGERQIGLGQLPFQGSLDLTTPSSVAITGALLAAGQLAQSSQLAHVDGVTDPAQFASPVNGDNFEVRSAYQTVLSSDVLSSYGLGALSIKSNDLLVAQGSTLSLAPGGAFSAEAGGAIDVAGRIAVAGGSVSLSIDRNGIGRAFGTGTVGRFQAPTRNNVAIAADVFIGGEIDVSGRFVNDLNRYGADAAGPAYINGGSIAITTKKSSGATGADGAFDSTGSIRLAAGGRLDASSGGYISAQGKTKTVSPGVNAGKGGSISLVLYQGVDFDDQGSGGKPTTPPAGPTAVLQLDGTMRASGFESNGTLRLGSVNTVRIGGSLQAGEASAIEIGGVRTVLPASLLTSGGFGAYAIESISDGYNGANVGVVLSAGTNLTLRQRNLASTVDYRAVGTGMRIADIAPVGVLPDAQRKPVDIAFKAADILLDQGSRIATDPGAALYFGGSPDTNPQAPELRDVAAGNVVLRGTIVDHGGRVVVNAQATRLGSQALVDLSGTVVSESRFGIPGGPVVGDHIVSGGTFIVDAAGLVNVPGTDEYVADHAPAGSYVVAEDGALVDVSGAAGVVRAASGDKRGADAVWSWSDGGTVQVNAAGFAWGGTFAAGGGRYVGADGRTRRDARAANGTLILGGGNVSIGQITGSVGPATVPTGIRIGADHLAAFDDAYIYSGTAMGGAGRLFASLPTNTYGYTAPQLAALNLEGVLDLALSGRLHLAASQITSSGDATITAPYVLFTGGGANAVAGSSTLTVNSLNIDVESATFSGFGQVNFNSSYDIRLSTPRVANGQLNGAEVVPDPATFSGSLVTAGDLTLSARRIYPVSAVDFTIQTPGRVTFAAPESSAQLPLSAGGSLTVWASEISQGGNLFAPLGKITLGNLDPATQMLGGAPTIMTQSVTLSPGSLTSVTLDGTIVPFGETADGTNWYYNASTSPLTQPPTKGLVLAGTDVLVTSGATIDTRGGGELQASEWIPGKGGSRDTLATAPGQSTVYALLPWMSDPLSAFDVHYTSARTQALPGDTYPRAGTQVTIDGGSGIPAGTYTLYPAHYATLPGAYRIVYYGDNLGRNLRSGTTLPDGTVITTGRYAQSGLPGRQSAGQALFAIRTESVWQQYSEYSFSRTERYFTDKASHDGTGVPRLPMDAGRLAVVAQQQIVLAGIALTQPAPGGRGGELDISASALAVGRASQPGTTVVDVAQLNNFGFDSILIGGRRTDQADGSTLIAPTASWVEVDTGGVTWSTPEILLAAKPSSPADTTGGAIVIAGNTVLESDSAVADSVHPRSYTMSGAGALFLATTDQRLSVSGPNGTGNGTISIAETVRIATDTLTLQATSETNAIALNTSHLEARQVNLAAKTIGIGAPSVGAVTDKSLVLAANSTQFAAVQALSLKALAGAITVYGNFDPGLGQGGGGRPNLTFDARTIAGTGSDATINVGGGSITLVNSGDAAAMSNPSAAGALEFKAADVALGGGTQAILGFADVKLTATDRVRVAASGKLTFGFDADQIDAATDELPAAAPRVDVTMTTPLVFVEKATTTGAGGQFALLTRGDLRIDRAGAPVSATRPADSGQIGGNLAMRAAGIEVSSTIQAQAGTLALRATEGDVTLGAGAYLAAGGYKKTLLDQDTYVAGGKVVLRADVGNVVTRAGSTTDVAQPSGGIGYGGEIEIIATAGAADLQGALRGGGGPGLGGRFKLDTHGAVDLDTLAGRLLAGGLTGAIDIHTRTGNLVLSAGQWLRANAITLTADDRTWNPATGSTYGQVIIAGGIDARGYGDDDHGTIDGNGQAGGKVGLWGANGVTLASTGVIDASTAHSDERGGDVIVGIGWDAQSWDPVGKTGGIDLQPGAIVDVHGGAKGGWSGGTVTVRAPLVGEDDVKITRIGSAISGARAVTVEGFISFSTDGTGGIDGRTLVGSDGVTPVVWDGVIDPAGTGARARFYTDTLKAVAQGRWIYNGESYGFGDGSSGAIARLGLGTLGQQLGAEVVHVRPGIDLVNPNAAINGGNITIASNWNLAAGSAYNLQNNPSNGSRYVHVHDTSNAAQQSYVTFDYRLVADLGSGKAIEAGALTLRALNDIVVDASISDGFFQFRDYLDNTYNTSRITSYLAGIAAANRGIDPTAGGFGGSNTPPGPNYAYYLNKYISNRTQPFAPYKATANGVSPTSQDLAAADLFPNELNVCVQNCGTPNGVNTGVAGREIVRVTDPASWSYRLTAGADMASANPGAMRSAADAGPSGNITINNHATYQQRLLTVNASTSAANTTATVNLPTMVRTGTGDIGIFAARDVRITDAVAPGVIYAGGVNTPRLADPNYSLQSGAVVAGNPDGFFEPQVMLYGASAAVLGHTYYGPPIAAAFPHKGGDVHVEAQRDIVGYSGTSKTVQTAQYFKPWLLALSGITPAATTAAAASVIRMGRGVYAPFGTDVASQGAWWIQYGSFQEGILSAGGNVTVIAGRDLRDVSVSLPTTGRVSGGLSATSLPVTHVYGSGNMTVRAGRDILGGAFYEGSGHATIVARGSIGASGTMLKIAGSTLEFPNVPLLALDLGQISMTAAGSVAINGVVNPAELHAQRGSFADPARLSTDAGNFVTPLYMDTYGPDSAARLASLAGDVSIAAAPSSFSVGTRDPFFSAATYPSTFEALALGGSITTSGLGTVGLTYAKHTGLILSPSKHGTLRLLAQDSIDLTFGYVNGTTAGRSNQLSSPIPNGPYISTGPSLLDAAFDPFRPNSGFSEPFSQAVLAHSDDDAIARIYAASGDIKAAGTSIVLNGEVTGYTRVEINQPAAIYAGRDIVDLNLIVQNVQSDDVSSLVAGRDIYYTGWNNAGGLQVAGPGFLVVEAGRDVGPFLPATHNIPSPPLRPDRADVQEGIVSVGNASITPVGNIYIRAGAVNMGGSVGMYNPALLGPSANTPKRRNALLPSAGADIVVRFGLQYGADYAAMARDYVDPSAIGSAVHHYGPELQAFLARIGIATVDVADAWQRFQGLADDRPQGRELQRIFLGQVLFSEMKAVATATNTGGADYGRGYRAVNTLFPASLGYTANALTGDTNGANEVVKTGDLELFHSTIQTRFGGDVSIFGPGGNIRVGQLAKESNPRLQDLRNLGIMTLGGGAINVFTDQNQLVNSSRIMTTQGGDVLLWSSNGDLNAGRGSQTILSLPPLQVVFDQDAYQSVDLGGFVTGSGIATLKTSRVATKANVYLMAPRGTIDAGTAGIRSDLGDAFVLAPRVENASNIKVGGTTTGIPTVSAPDVGSLSSASNAAGAATKSAETPTGSVPSGGGASIFIVEVVGYGGGDGATGSTPAPSGGESRPAPAGDNAAPAGATQPGVAPQSGDGDKDENGSR
ncbi:MAG TPA: filamentous hemagglutinin family protein [Xanthobacteraceae bacterium]|nr:filamentous hemagglutinin family protein [Xanthobacteraceae bacterium]